MIPNHDQMIYAKKENVFLAMGSKATPESAWCKWMKNGEDRIFAWKVKVERL